MNVTLKRILVGFAKIIGSIIIFVAALFGFNYYKVYPIQKFCNEVSPSASPEEVLKLAEIEGFPAFNVIEARGVVSILNQRSPYFRHACEIEYKNGKQTKKAVRNAD
jgi:hypothetical protein